MVTEEEGVLLTRKLSLQTIRQKELLFCNTPDGAQASAIIYSIIETAKVNNLNPYAYLEQIFEKLQKGCVLTECLS